MRPAARPRLAALALAGGLLGAVAPGLAADPARLADSDRATNAFVALAAGAETSGDAPRDSDPIVAGLLARILDAAAVDTAAPTIEDAEGASRLMGNAGRVLAAYMLAGTGLTDVSGLGANAAAGRAADANLTRFAPEVGRLYDFTLRMEGVVGEAAAGFAGTAGPADAEALKAELGRLSAGVRQSVDGVLDAVASGDFELGWRRERARMLGDAAPRLAKVLEAPALDALRARAAALAGSAGDPALSVELQRLGLTLKAR